MSCRARPLPTRRGRRWVPPPPGTSPRATSGWPNFALSTAIRIELGEPVHAILELAPLVLGVHVERGPVGRHHQAVAATLPQHVPELRRDAEAPLRVDRVPEMPPKHCPPHRGQTAPGTAPKCVRNGISWDFIPLPGTILEGVARGVKGKLQDFQGHSDPPHGLWVGGGRDRTTAGREPEEGEAGPSGPGGST